MQESKHNKQKTKTKILIVEDHDALRESLKRWLGNFFLNFQFLEADNGENAIKIALSSKPDIILMDISLPKINGIEATRIIKKSLPDTKVVILTIYDAPDYKNDALSAGVDTFIPKHRMQIELIATLKKLSHKS